MVEGLAVKVSLVNGRVPFGLSILRSCASVDVFSGWPRWWRDHTRKHRSPESKRHCGASRGLTPVALRPGDGFLCDDIGCLLRVSELG